jgi:hypothetical protein
LIYFVEHSVTLKFYVHLVYGVLIFSYILNECKRPFMIMVILLFIMPLDHPVFSRDIHAMDDGCHRSGAISHMEGYWEVCFLCMGTEKQEIENLFKKWFEGTHNVLLFDSKKTEFFMANKKADLSLTFLSDSGNMSEHMINFALNKKQIQPGTRFIVNRRNRMTEFDKRVLAKIFHEFLIVKIDETTSFNVYQCMDKVKPRDQDMGYWHVASIHRDDGFKLLGFMHPFEMNNGIGMVPLSQMESLKRAVIEVILETYQPGWVDRLQFMPGIYRWQNQIFKVFPKDFVVWGSLDGKDWALLGDSTGLKSEANDIYVMNVLSTKLRYIKMAMVYHTDFSFYAGESILDFEMLSLGKDVM